MGGSEGILVLNQLAPIPLLGVILILLVTVGVIIHAQMTGDKE